MAPSQASGQRLWSDPFSALPSEINIQVLQYLSLHDIRPAIVSSLILLRTLESNRQYILGPHLPKLLLSYGDVSSLHLAAAAMHLRKLHSKHEGNTITVLEKEVEPVLDSILRWNARTTEEMGDIRFYMVIAAQELLPEIIGALTMGPWDDLLVEFQHRSPGSLWPDMAPLGLRTAFSDGFLRFDCYRSLFHHKDRELFQKRAGIKDAFLNSFPEFPKFDDEILRMYPYMILGKIRHRYGEIMLELDRKDPDRRLAQGVVWPKGAWKKVLATTGIINYLNRTREQDDYFVFRLTLQGYPKLSFFEQLSPETLLSTMEEEFEELVVSNLEDCEAWTAHKGLHYHNLVRYFTLWSNKRQEQDSGTCNLM
ncbi:hypothetical protein FANTH_7083 [Fusarium anthophilum]|uniref:Uncharacterized protein n=1 Tax=Fusarium anthophilum TaxID=48485 RepID=A0A8H4ZGG7_9HYPO|nr:hypothetical protein FANTH_7083 [Fusarium anthophilum]